MLRRICCSFMARLSASPPMRQFAVLASVVLFVAGLPGCQHAPADVAVDPDRPGTVVEAVDVLYGWLSADERHSLAYKSEGELILLHHGFGTGIRNSLGLWAGNDALLRDCGGGHPDDCSMRIIEALHARLRAELSP